MDGTFDEFVAENDIGTRGISTPVVWLRWRVILEAEMSTAMP
jgi:hypothetical protein